MPYHLPHQVSSSERAARQSETESKRSEFAFDAEFSAAGLRFIQQNNVPDSEKPSSDWNTKFNTGLVTVGAGIAIHSVSFFKNIAKIRGNTFDDLFELEDRFLDDPTEENAANYYDSLTSIVTDDGKTNQVKEYFDILYRKQDNETLKGKDAELFDDAAFARISVAGPAPTNIKRVTQTEFESFANRGFPVTDDIFLEASPFTLAGDTSLQEMVDEGRLYIEDYSMLSDIKGQDETSKQEKRFIYSPIALYAVTLDNPTLLPIAIQCNENENKGYQPIFVPHIPGAATANSDRTGIPGDYSWQIAKTIVGNAHNIDHESAGHLGRAHLVTEVFILATNRQLPDNHPINAILQPHFEGTLHINDFARKTLINTGGQVDQYLAPVITEFVRKAAESVLATKLQDQLPLQNMQNRDVDDLPYYPYRDDAKALWGAIRQYTETFLDNYYDSDQDVLADLDIAAGGELGAWWQELTTTQVFENNNMPGFDLGTLTTREELYDLVAYIIFNSSVQHAAVNYPQGDYFTSVALMPGTIARPTPVPGDANQDYYLESLPTKTLALAQTQLMKILTFFRHTQLGKFDESFDDDQVFTATTNFTEDLLQIEAEIDARNEALPEAHRYTYLRPSNVPQSTNL